MKRAVKTRKTKIEDNIPKPSPREKFIQAEAEIEGMRSAPIPKFIPATANQKEAVGYLRDGVRVLFLVGSAGSGKSMLAAWWAATLLKEKKIEKVYLVRPAVVTGKSNGLLPGTEREKLEPYFVQTLIHLSTFLGHGYLNYCLDHDLIELKSGEYLRGRSFENCCVISEETQNFTASDLEMVLTRLGKNATLLLTGDTKQNDLKGMSGFRQTVDLINNMIQSEPDYLTDDDLDKLSKLVAGVEFSPDDCVRDDLTKAFVKMYYHN